MNTNVRDEPAAIFIGHVGLFIRYKWSLNSSLFPLNSTTTRELKFVAYSHVSYMNVELDDELEGGNSFWSSLFET